MLTNGLEQQSFPTLLVNYRKTDRPGPYIERCENSSNRSVSTLKLSSHVELAFNYAHFWLSFVPAFYFLVVITY